MESKSAGEVYEDMARAVFALNKSLENHNKAIEGLHDRLSSVEAILSQMIEDQGGITNLDDEDDADGDPIDDLIRREDADEDDFE